MSDGKIVSLDSFRKEPGAFAVSITIETDGKVTVDRDTAYLASVEEIDWAIALIVMGLGDLVDMKRELRGEK